MKRKFLLLALVLGLAACNNGTKMLTPSENIDVKDYQTSKSGELGTFNLIGPGTGLILEGVREFEWEASTNAEKYTLEICSSEFFISDIDTIDYYSAKNITTTSFVINSEYQFKDTTYYWRVTAYNNSGKKECNTVFNFFIKAPEVDEVHFDLGEADDWTLHPVGSYADISMDDTNFFKNDEKSLKLQFKKEDTNRGIPESDGWIIVTKTIEKSIYGTDGLFFNMYYSGHQADVIIRLVDRDNEYWYAPALISNNAKQSVILQFSEFKQRTGDVTVANMEFDYERIKYLEIVFEKTFGDGVFLLSGMKAIKFSNYRNFFLDTLNFNEYSEEQYAFETYTYDVAVNETEVAITHYNDTANGHNKINGYGFFKLNVDRYFVKGDAIRIKVKYTGSSGSNVLLRLYEEDTDRWFYRFPYSKLSGEYQEFIIPYGAFAASSLMGDGRRQFYYILNIQFGCEGQYGNGTIYFKDFEIVKLSEVHPSQERIINSNGIIDDFNNYQSTAEVFLDWQHSEDNKDEYMTINNTNKVGGVSNPYCGQFEYKSDMMEAMYYLPISTSVSFDGFSIWMKDGSVKPGETKVDHVTNWSPQVRLLIRLTTFEIYEYVINPLPRMWNEYNVAFTDFTLTNDKELKVPANPITSQAITHIGFAFQYYYYDASGRAMPMYSISNPVYVDNIKFTNGVATGVEAKEKVIRTVDNITKFDDFEDYNVTGDLEDVWSNAKSYDYQKIELSNDVSSEGDNHSMAVQFQSHGESPSYAMSPYIDSGVVAKGVRFSIKCSVPCTVFFNVYLTVGKTTQQYRIQIDNAPSVWTEYTIGFDRFSVVQGQTTRKFISTDLQFLQKVTFGAVYNGDAEAELYDLFIDNFEFDYSVSYAVNTARTID